MPPLRCDIGIDALSLKKRDHILGTQTSYHGLSLSFTVMFAIAVSKAVLPIICAGAYPNLDCGQCFSATHPLEGVHSAGQFCFPNLVPRAFQGFTQHQSEGCALRKPPIPAPFFSLSAQA